MKVNSLIENAKPTVAYRQNGDKSWTARVEYSDGKVFVHTNKNKTTLDKLVDERYFKYAPKS